MASRSSAVPTALHYRLGHKRTPTYAIACILCVVWVLWLVSLWQWRHHAAVWWWALGFILVYVCIAYAAWRWQRQLPTSYLVWTGVHWCLQPISGSAALPRTPAYKQCICVLDVHTALLLRLALCTHKKPVAQVRWVWVQAASAPSHWHALRAAVYAQKNA